MSGVNKVCRGVRTVLVFIVSLVLLTPVSRAWASSLPQLPKDAALYLIDDKTGDVIASQRADEKMYPASLTKMMTALVALDYVGDKLDEDIEVGEEVKLTPPESSVMGCQEGDVYSWRDLLYGMLLPSGGDAAIVLGTQVGRLAAGDSKLATDKALHLFIDLMNKKAQAMRLSQTHFANVHGFHDVNNYSCAQDLTVIAQAVLANEFLSEVVATQSHECVNKKDSNLTVYNTNWLIDSTAANIEGDELVGEGESGVDNPYYKQDCIGIKTGYTEEARRCLAFAGTNEQMSCVGVILHIADKPTIYATTGAMLDSVLSEFERKNPESDMLPYTVEIKNPSLKDRINHNTLLRLRSRAEARPLTVDTTLSYEVKVTWDGDYVAENSEGAYELKQTLYAGDEVARLQVLSDGDVIQDIPLYSDQSMRLFSREDVLELVAISAGAVVLLVLVVFAVRLLKGRKSHREA